MTESMLCNMVKPETVYTVELVIVFHMEFLTYLGFSIIVRIVAIAILGNQSCELFSSKGFEFGENTFL